MNQLLIEALVYLGAAVVAVPISKQLGLGSVLGYLIAGIVIGPLFGWVGDETNEIQHVAEFGVVMMLFLVGLELAPKKLYELRARLLGLGGLQVGLTTGLFFALGLSFGLTWSVALAVAMLLSLSSTAIVLQTLNEKGMMNSAGGRSSFAVLLFQDIAVIPMLAFIPLLALPELMAAGQAQTTGHGVSLVEHLQGWQRAIITVFAIAAIIVTGRYLVRPMFRVIALTRLREMFTAFALLLVVGISALMGVIGLSAALGTFLAGVVLANSEYRHELESTIEPFKGLLLGLFFITVGAGMDFSLLLNDTSLIVLATLLVITVKFSVLFVLGLLFKLRAANNWMFALSLAQAGEFGFVLLSFSQQNSVLPDALADQLLLVIALSMLLTPILFLLLERLIIPFHRNRGLEPEADEIDARSPVIIAGHGRVGQIVNRILEMSGYQPTVIDVDIEVTEGLSKLGFKTYFGDAVRPELLESAGIAQAKLLVIAIDDKRRALTLAEHVSRDYPHVTIVARAHDRPHTYNLYQAGVRGSIVRETFDSSVRLGWGALEALGHDPELAKEAASIFFDRDRQLVFEAAELHDPNAPRFTNKEMIEKSREMDSETAVMVRAVLQRAKEN